MIFILIVILSSASINILFKVFQRLGIDSMQAIIFNYVTATSLGIYLAPTVYSPAEMLSHGWFYLGMILGASFLITMKLYAISTAHIGVALTTILARTSLIIPAIISFFIFGEELSIRLILGIVFILVAVFLIFYDKNNIIQNFNSGKKSLFVLFLPVIVFTFCGFNDTMIKVTQFFYIKNSDDNSLFIATVFCTALIVGVAIYIGSGSYKKMKFSWKSILGGVILGSVNLLSSMSILKALESIPASVTFPIVNIGIILVSILVGVFFFKEKLTYRKSLGIFIALVAIVMMTI